MSERKIIYGGAEHAIYRPEDDLEKRILAFRLAIYCWPDQGKVSVDDVLKSAREILRFMNGENGEIAALHAVEAKSATLSE